MRRILIFKTDRVGDLINITPIINNIKLNYKDCDIDLICSEYNSQIAKYISDIKNIYVYKNSLFNFIFNNFKNIFLTKYDVIFQLDGKNHSFFLTLLFRSPLKYSLKFIKQKKIFSKFYSVSRPNLIYQNFIKTIDCYENYNLEDNKSYHYLSLYLNLLKNAKLKILDKKHNFKFKPSKRIAKFQNSYVHLHLDEKWLSVGSNIRNSLIKYLSSLSIENNIVITSNLGENDFFNNMYNHFYNNKKFEFINSPTFDNLISIVFFSHTCISSHSGFIVHLAACYKKNIVDIVDSKIFNELDRWMPYDISYKRYDINYIENIILNKN